MPEQEWLTPEDVAAVTGVEARTVHRWLRLGKIPAVNLGHRVGYRIRRSDLDQYLAQLPKKAPTVRYDDGLSGTQRWLRRHGGDKDHNRYLLRRYGITLDQYNDMVAAQNGVCALCGQPEKRLSRSDFNKTPRRLAVDHNHQTGKIRGLLCHDCNVAIGFLRERPELIRKVIDYLESHQDAALTET